MGSPEHELNAVISVSGPLYRLIFAVDLEDSTMRTNPVKGKLRQVIYGLIKQARAELQIADSLLERATDRGDGVLLLFRPDDGLPKTGILDQLIPVLARLLREYNAQVAEQALRIRLRAVVHAGEVHVVA